MPQTKEDVMRIVELTVLAMLTLIVLLAVVRPLLRKMLDTESGAVALVAGPATTGDPSMTTMLVPRENTAARLVDFAKMNGQVQSEAVPRVVEMVRASPNETVEVLRNWINET
jgi:flagellar M-ring protein FliF